MRVENSERSTVRVARDAIRLVRDLFLVRQWSVEGRYDLTGDDLLEAARKPVGPPEAAAGLR